MTVEPLNELSKNRRIQGSQDSNLGFAVLSSSSPLFSSGRKSTAADSLFFKNKIFGTWAPLFRFILEAPVFGAKKKRRNLCRPSNPRAALLPPLDGLLPSKALEFGKRESRATTPSTARKVCSPHNHHYRELLDSLVERSPKKLRLTFGLSIVRTT